MITKRIAHSRVIFRCSKCLRAGTAPIRVRLSVGGCLSQSHAGIQRHDTDQSIAYRRAVHSCMAYGPRRSDLRVLSPSPRLPVSDGLSVSSTPARMSSRCMTYCLVRCRPTRACPRVMSTPTACVCAAATTALFGGEGLVLRLSGRPASAPNNTIGTRQPELARRRLMDCQSLRGRGELAVWSRQPFVTVTGLSADRHVGDLKQATSWQFSERGDVFCALIDGV